METKWLDWVKSLRGIARAGLTYTENPYDRERFTQIMGIAAEMMASTAMLDLASVSADYANQMGYETPKVDVRGVVFHNDAILLVKELADGGRWTLPGGWAENTDLPHEAVEREVWEESGYRTKVTKLLAVYDRRLHGHPPFQYGIYKLFFRCEITGGQPAESLETSGAAFFAENAIPELSLGRVTPSELARLFEHMRNPDLPTDFDWKFFRQGGIIHSALHPLSAAQLEGKTVVRRYTSNPILTYENVPFPAALVFNAGVAKYENRYVRVFRNDYGDYAAQHLTGTNLGLATSVDGIHWGVHQVLCFVNAEQLYRQCVNQPGDVFLRVIVRILHMCIMNHKCEIWFPLFF